ncbi:unnamed protein product [Nezara viridula]|uniref:Uncharacterized protein n=1 Tax=Nezara viridula TaxID=85310 RepID=A0A9P0HNS1_NEZVI|nr:unnamed protein product [Nezara viridula]
MLILTLLKSESKGCSQARVYEHAQRIDTAGCATSILAESKEVHNPLNLDNQVERRMVDASIVIHGFHPNFHPRMTRVDNIIVAIREKTASSPLSEH